MKKAFLAIFLVLALTALAVGPSQAAPAFSTCTVYSTGVKYGSSGVYYQVATLTADGGAFTQKLFYLYQPSGKELLATMLTAQAAGKKVYVWADSTWVYSAYVGDYP